MLPLQGHGFDPWSGNYSSWCMIWLEKKKKTIIFFIFYDNIYFIKTVFLGMCLCVHISIWSSIKENFTVFFFSGHYYLFYYLCSLENNIVEQKLRVLKMLCSVYQTCQVCHCVHFIYFFKLIDIN